MSKPISLLGPNHPFLGGISKLTSVTLFGRTFTAKQVFKNCLVIQVNGPQAQIKLTNRVIGILDDAGNLAAGKTVDVKVKEILDDPNTGPIIFLSLVKQPLKVGSLIHDCVVTSALGEVAFVQINGCHGIVSGAQELQIGDHIDVRVANADQATSPLFQQLEILASTPRLSLVRKIDPAIQPEHLFSFEEAKVTELIERPGQISFRLKRGNGRPLIIPGRLTVGDIPEVGETVWVSLAGAVEKKLVYGLTKSFFTVAPKLFEAVAEQALFTIGERVEISRHEGQTTTLLYAAQPIVVGDISYYPRGAITTPDSYNFLNSVSHFRLSPPLGGLITIKDLIKALAKGELLATLVNPEIPAEESRPF